MIISNRYTTSLIACLIVLMGVGCASEQTQFESPQAAVDSLVGALRKNDTSKLKSIFGPDAGEIISSGDPVADKAEGARFLSAYEDGHRFQTDNQNRQVLLVGKQDWPFPVPIADDEKGKGKYVFDTAAGKDELLNRRIGRNELSAAQVCLAIVDAQREYVALRPNGGEIPLYASKVVSTPGTKDGLYWPTAENEPPSPLGELVAAASEEGYGTKREEGKPPPPYHGYRYRLLTAQGPSATGGAVDYIANGKLIGGFAVIAYPAQYGNSGIMTFITNHDGVVYQRDLGPNTETVAQAMGTFDPTNEWTRMLEAAQAVAGGTGN